jgi:Flp pilus assembly pilin Flp
MSKIQLKALELLNRLRDIKDEVGQTSAEYVAVTAVAVAIAVTVIYATLGGALSEAVASIGDTITEFVADPGPITPPVEPDP